MGTAFLITRESGAHPIYKSELVKCKSCEADMTTLTEAYSGKMARGINTDFIEYIEASVSSIPPYPIANMLSSPIRKEAAKKQASHIMSMWCGQGTPQVADNLTASELLKKLRSGIEKSLNDYSAFQMRVKR